ncbi:MAG: hypothetical protein K2I18_04375, partial [Paramuribaculum sp.]|nr:hypothetical protein [Paramuribaculum sp.]
MKFCENFQQSRISADKRFLKKICIPPLYPQTRNWLVWAKPCWRGLRCGLRRKVIKYFKIARNSVPKNIHAAYKRTLPINMGRRFSSAVQAGRKKTPQELRDITSCPV